MRCSSTKRVAWDYLYEMLHKPAGGLIVNFICCTWQDNMLGVWIRSYWGGCFLPGICKIVSRSTVPSSTFGQRPGQLHGRTPTSQPTVLVDAVAAALGVKQPVGCSAFRTRRQRLSGMPNRVTTYQSAMVGRNPLSRHVTDNTIFLE